MFNRHFGKSRQEVRGIETSYIIAVAIAAVYFAGVTQGLTGFGFSLVSVPILVAILTPRTVIPVVLLLSVLLNLQLYIHVRKAADLRRIAPLVVTGIASMPVGTWLLVRLDVAVIKLVVGVVILIFSLAFLTGFRRESENERLGLSLVGLASGTLNGMISMSGPPVILFLTNQGVAKQAFRASLITYFLFLNLATVPVFLAGGLLSGQVLKYALASVPALILGAYTGNRLVHRIPEHHFRTVVLLVVIIAGVMSALSGLGLI